MNVPSEILAALIGVAAMLVLNVFYNPQREKNNELSEEIKDLKKRFHDQNLQNAKEFVSQVHFDKQIDEVKVLIRELAAAR